MNFLFDFPSHFFFYTEYTNLIKQIQERGIKFATYTLIIKNNVLYKICPAWRNRYFLEEFKDAEDVGGLCIIKLVCTRNFIHYIHISAINLLHWCNRANASRSLRYNQLLYFWQIDLPRPDKVLPVALYIKLVGRMCITYISSRKKRKPFKYFQLYFLHWNLSIKKVARTHIYVCKSGKNEPNYIQSFITWSCTVWRVKKFFIIFWCKNCF